MREVIRRSRTYKIPRKPNELRAGPQLTNCASSSPISPMPPQGVSLEIPKGRGSQKPKVLKKSVRQNCNFQKSGGGRGSK